MTQTSSTEAGLTIDEQAWQEIELPPTDLPYDDGEPMESPWHFKNAALIVASYVAALRRRGPLPAAARMRTIPYRGAADCDAARLTTGKRGRRSPSKPAGGRRVP